MNKQWVILGAGRPYRGDAPSAVLETPGKRRVLDWILEAIRPLGEIRVTFAGGYRIDHILKNYPSLHCVYNPDWQETGPVVSLLAVPMSENEELWVCYADVVFRSNSVEALIHAQGSAGLYDGAWKERYAGRTSEDLTAAEKAIVNPSGFLEFGPEISVEEASGEFAGLVKLNPDAVRMLKEWSRTRSHEMRQWSLPKLFLELNRAGKPLSAVKVVGGWAELNAPQDLARFVFGTKAETLDRLRPLVTRSLIGEGFAFNVAEWRRSPWMVLSRVRALFGPDAVLAIRSNAKTEDRWDASQAGKFKSVLDVPSEGSRIQEAINEVIVSYGEDANDQDVLVQFMVRDVVLSGVVFTRTLLRGGPYYTINFNDQSPDTTLVTSGAEQNLRMVVLRRQPDAAPLSPDPRLAAVVSAAAEIEECVGYDSLDIEFAVDSAGRTHILQVRPLPAHRTFQDVSDSAVHDAAAAARDLFGAFQAPRPGVVGKKAVFGVMPDWNPAEIIGTKPRPFAFSLYRYLITDEVWADQRAEAGYRDIRPHPLLVAFGGMPFVDVRASFNSFVPAGLNHDLADRLVNHYLQVLESYPDRHDKVEFEVAMTSLDFDFDRRASEELEAAGWAGSEIATFKQALSEITLRHLESVDDFWTRAEDLNRRFELWMAGGHDPWERACGLLAECRKSGTIIFAHLARAAFMSVALLRSLAQRGALRELDKNIFLESLHTVTRSIQTDAYEVAQGRMPQEAFIQKYGHLRPGTYDITSPRYDSDSRRFLEPMIASASCAEWAESTSARQKIVDTLDRELPLLDWNISGERLEGIMRRAIEGREYAKFIFTRYLSQAMEDFKCFGVSCGMDAEDLSFLELEDLKNAKLQTRVEKLSEWLRRRVSENRRNYAVTLALELPALLCDGSDFDVFEKPDSRPNFVTHERVVAPANLIEAAAVKDELEGCIALIPAADPGFDWLFGCGIKGLITMYGGANSHMAIRAAENRLPAAVGVGEKLFDQLLGGRLVDLDCASERIRILP